jgi:hypothetical protein
MCDRTKISDWKIESYRVKGTENEITEIIMKDERE